MCVMRVELYVYDVGVIFPDHGSQLKKEGTEVMKRLKIDLQLVVKGIRAINNRLDKAIKAVENATPKGSSKKTVSTKKKTAKKASTPKKAADQVTAFDTVVQIVAGSKQGVNTSQIKEKTGFDDKKIANIIYKAKNRKLIKSVSKGIYSKA